MNQHSTFPPHIYSNYLELFIEEVSRIASEEDLAIYDAITTYFMNLWGLTGDDGATFSDGHGDRGIDWYRTTRQTADV